MDKMYKHQVEQKLQELKSLTDEVVKKTQDLEQANNRVDKHFESESEKNKKDDSGSGSSRSSKNIGKKK
ncbi:hypothetical protein ACJIZ3_021807 [Penstemon smallii]|uniref:Uncharacterized protein n=1 Tax=Penstemon smallii TaxID=265156 RepID=A0ABD3SNF8_9LAMI